MKNTNKISSAPHKHWDNAPKGQKSLRFYLKYLHLFFWRWIKVLWAWNNMRVS